MVSIFRLGLHLIPLAIVAIVCAEDIAPNSFIRKRGTYTFDAAGSFIDVITARDQKPSLVLEFRAKHKGSTSRDAYSFHETGILRAEGWFVFIESTNRLWIFDGKNSLSIAERSQTPTNIVTKIKDFDSEAAALCPPEVKQALPDDVRTSLFKR